MVGSQQLKLGRANFAPHPVRHRNQNRQLDHRSSLNRRLVRRVAHRASRVRTPRVMVRQGRLGCHEQQCEDGQADD